MNILVIGNGFDLAHGLPTKYGDFLRYIRRFRQFWQTHTRPVDVVDEKERGFVDHIEKGYYDRSKAYEEFAKLTFGNLWIDYFLSIFETREKHGKDGWIDFESEISSIIQILDEFRSSTEILDDEFVLHDLCTLFKTNEFSIFENIPNLKKLLLNALNQLIRALEIYLSSYVQSTPVSRLKDIKTLDIDCILSFNYTNTAERLYRRNVHAMNYDYIHGKADINSSVDKCNMVLGIDEYLSDGRRDSDNEFIEFKKFYQRIFKATGSHYIDWIKKISKELKEYSRDLKEYNEESKKYEEEREKKLFPSRTKPAPPFFTGMYVYIYGHSLDVTDKDILRRLILQDGAVTTIYYYDKKDLGNKIANLVKVIGEDELIRRTGGKNATIKFKETTKENGV